MKLYLAHNFVARESLCPLKASLEARGYEVTSRWLTEDDHRFEDPKNGRLIAEEDLEDIQAADVLVLFVDQVGTRPGKGKWIELGYALGLGKKVVLCGEDRNSSVFFYLPGLRFAWDFESLGEELDAIRNEKREELQDTARGHYLGCHD